MIDIFGDESEMKPLVRYGVNLPGYYATRCGKIFRIVGTRNWYSTYRVNSYE